MTLQTFARGTVLAIGLAASLTGPVAAEDQKGGVVAIGGSVTEIIYALGEQDQLVARDTTSMFPPEASELPDVGYIRALSPEGVLSVNPKKIVALEGSGPPESLDVLKKASVPIVIIPEGYSREGIVNKIKAVGAAAFVGGSAFGVSCLASLVSVPTCLACLVSVPTLHHVRCLSSMFLYVATARSRPLRSGGGLGGRGEARSGGGGDARGEMLFLGSGSEFVWFG